MFPDDKLLWFHWLSHVYAAIALVIQTLGCIMVAKIGLLDQDAKRGFCQDCRGEKVLTGATVLIII